ncbi:type VI secretion system protein TssA [Rahnella sp. S5-11]|uniref:type VI secretion system protein TssA n=1 Tax=Rahnella selenatireducens TaxID=3389797 RepID=UPI0039683A99
MDTQASGAWFGQVLASLPEEKIRSAMSETHPDWEYIDSEMVKLGSLTHGQLDIAEIQQKALKLLMTESKDFRLMVHLLRTLQHGGKATELLLALQLLARYTEQFWLHAWPQKAAHKNRFAQQVLKRFETAAISFASDADRTQRDAMLSEFAHLAQLWKQQDSLLLSQSADELVTLYQRRIQEHAAEATVRQERPAPEMSGTGGIEQTQNQHPVATVSIETHDDKSWRQTLLKVADVLCERHPQSTTGYRLRRHALWQNITTAPQAESGGRTSLAAFPADMMADYQARLPAATPEFWEQVEKSLLLAPYWFDGHCLSSRIACQLGYVETAAAIRDELNTFIGRIPALRNLQFTDHTPFLCEQTHSWLEEDHTSKAISGVSATHDDETNNIWQCFSEQGLTPALQRLEQLQQQSSGPRQLFYQQFLGVQLLEKAGLQASAQQQYITLHHAARQITLPDWEPALLEQLKVKITTEQ